MQNKNLLKGTLSLFSGFGLRKILGFASIVLAARVVAREQFGIFVLFETIYLTVFMLSDFGLMPATTRAIATEDVEEKKYIVIGNAVLLRLITVGSICLMLLPARGIFTHIFKSSLLDSIAMYLPITIFLICLNELYSYILLGLHRHVKMAIGNAVGGVANLLGILILVWKMKLGIVGMVWSLMLSCGASLIYQYVAVGVKIPVRFNPPVMKKLLWFGLPLHLNTLLSIIFMRLDTYFISVFSGPTAVANYGIAMKIPENIRQLFESYRLVYFSTMSKLYSMKLVDEVSEILGSTIRISAFILFGGTLGTILFRNEAVLIIFSEKYLDCSHAFSVLMASFSILLFNTFFGTTLVAADRPRRAMEITFVIAFTSAVAYLICIPRFGFLGAAYASLITYSAMVPIFVWSLKRIGIVFKCALLLKPLGVFLIALTIYFGFPLREWISVRIFICILYVLISFMLGIVGINDWALLRRSLSAEKGNESEVAG